MKLFNITTSLVLLATLLSGCTAMGDKEQNRSVQFDSLTVQYKVKAGDSLSDIALKLTGDMSNWQTIAGHNNITEPETLGVGQLIRIPTELLDSSLSADNRLADARAAQSITTGGNTPIRVPVITGNGVSVARRATLAIDPGSADVTLFPVNVDRSFDLIPLNPFNGKGPVRYGSQPPKVQVAGTYYPKGLYAQPVSYARLLSRVSPGTIFQLESVVNDWYKVITDTGVGYIRHSDSTLLR